MAASGVRLWTCEIQNGNRPFAVTSEGNPRHLQLRTQEDIWHKENALNLMIQRLPSDWENVAWIDADITFNRTDWALETVQQLQTYEVVQMFQTAIDLGPLGEAMQTHQGFMYSYLHGKPFNKAYASWHPGFSWAATRNAINGLGCLIDRAILGSADRHMAMSLIGKGAESVNLGLTDNYKHMVLEWQSRAEKYVKRDVGYVAGTIFHGYHGQKVDRQYADRWKILVDNKYDPYKEIFPDWQGLYKLDDDSVKLRDDIRRYFRQRNEDNFSIDLMP